MVCFLVLAVACLSAIKRFIALKRSRSTSTDSDDKSEQRKKKQNSIERKYSETFIREKSLKSK